MHDTMTQPAINPESIKRARELNLQRRAVKARTQAWMEARAVCPEMTYEAFEVACRAMADSCWRFAVLVEDCWGHSR